MARVCACLSSAVLPPLLTPEGTHEELIKQGGVYTALLEAQKLKGSQETEVGSFGEGSRERAGATGRNGGIESESGVMRLARRIFEGSGRAILSSSSSSTAASSSGRTSRSRASGNSHSDLAYSSVPSETGLGSYWVLGDDDDDDDCGEAVNEGANYGGCSRKTSNSFWRLMRLNKPECGYIMVGSLCALCLGFYRPFMSYLISEMISALR